MRKEKIFWMAASLLILTPLVAFAAGSLADPGACGDEGLVCNPDERCYEHVVATFSGTGPVGPSVVVGKCVPQTVRVTDFWCGNRHCQPGFFGSPTVCCINEGEGGSDDYSCASSELSCPGNREQLSIRTREPERTLRRG